MNVVESLSMSERATAAFRIAGNSKEAEDGCLEWTGSVDRNGYGKYSRSHRGLRIQTGAHRMAYLMKHGAIAAGMTINHKCYNKLCVNPDHLEEMTVAENVQDSFKRPGRKAGRYKIENRTHCKWGHPWVEETISRDKRGYPHCRLCTNPAGRRARKLAHK